MGVGAGVSGSHLTPSSRTVSSSAMGEVYGQLTSDHSIVSPSPRARDYHSPSEYDHPARELGPSGPELWASRLNCPC
jgi:hypothetical protein